MRKVFGRTSRRAAGVTALAAALLSNLPAVASQSPAPHIFEKFYADMGFVAAAAAGVAVLVMILRGLRDAGYLSDRWRFGEECDPD